MSESPQSNDEDRLLEPLKSVVESIARDLPNEITTESFLRDVKGREPARPTPTDTVTGVERPHRGLWIGMVAMTAAAVVLVGWFRLPPASALDRIAGALSNVRCIKSTTIIGNKTSERWVMLADGQRASRDDDWIEFASMRNKTELTYHRHTEQFIRSGLTRRQSSTFLTELVESLAEAGKGNTPQSIRGMSVKSASVSSVDGKRVLQLQLASSDDTVAASATIDLQENSDLPSSGVVCFTRGGQSRTIETTWEYPPTGPANIFALGVPKQTTLIDRIPTPAVKQLAADVYKGRLKFDDYRAVVFDTDSESLLQIDRFELALVSKKGNRLVLLKNAEKILALEGRSRVAVAEDILRNPESIRWYPRWIVNGRLAYKFSSPIAETPDAVPALSFQSILIGETAEPVPLPSGNLIPHWVGRPAMGIGAAHIGASIEDSSEAGPEDCILLRTYTSNPLNAAESHTVRTDWQRAVTDDYWISPAKDFLVVENRTQWEDGSASVRSLGRLAQSPSGYWYPQTFKRSHSAGMNGKPPYSDSVGSFYVDFSESLPEAMFDPKEYMRDK